MTNEEAKQIRAKCQIWARVGAILLFIVALWVQLEWKQAKAVKAVFLGLCPSCHRCEISLTFGLA